MASITDLRAGLASNIATITGLRTTTETPDTISPPIAIINVANVNYDKAFARGLDDYKRAVVSHIRYSKRVAFATERLI